jgi:hypothetical protein
MATMSGRFRMWRCAALVLLIGVPSGARSMDRSSAGHATSAPIASTTAGPFDLTGFEDRADGTMLFRSPRMRMLLDGADARILVPAAQREPMPRGRVPVTAITLSHECMSGRPAPLRGEDLLAGTVTEFRRGAAPRRVRRWRSVAPKRIAGAVALYWTTAPSGAPRFDLHVPAGVSVEETVFTLTTSGDEPPTLHLDGDGSMRVALGDAAVLRLSAPVAWERTPLCDAPVEARFEILGEGRFRFRALARDPRWPLIIDPEIAPAVLHGGSGLDYAWAVTTHGSDGILVTGATSSVDLPVVDPFQQNNAGGVLQSDAYLALFDARTGALRWASYLGGSDPDFGVAATVLDDGRVFLLGATDSRDLPTVDPYQDEFAGGDSDLFTARISPDGTVLEECSYLGGSGLEEGWGIAGDGAGGVWIAGLSESTDFPVVDALQEGNGGGMDVFISRFSATGGGPVFSTLLGGSADDQARAIAREPDGGLVIAGWTASPNFPVTDDGGTGRRGVSDGFVLSIAPDADSVRWSTLLGGESADHARGVAVDGSGRVWAAGWTSGAGLPVTAAFQSAPGGGPTDGWLARLGPGGTTPDLVTYIGGSGPDEARAVTVDASGGIVVAGATLSTDFPLLHAPTTGPRGSLDAFALRVDSVDGSLAASSVVGGAGSDEFQAVTALLDGTVACAGHAHHASPATPDFPSTARHVPAAGGGPRDALVAVVDFRESGLASPKGRWLRGEGGTASQVRIGARLTGEGPQAASDFDPVVSALELRCGPESTLRIEADDSGWRATKAGLRWTSPAGGEEPRVVLTLDRRRNRIRCTSRGGGPLPPDDAGSLELVLHLGDARLGAIGEIRGSRRTVRILPVR